MRETMIEGLSGPIRAVEAGSGPGVPVLFVHSFAGSSAQWSPQEARVGEPARRRDRPARPRPLRCVDGRRTTSARSPTTSARPPTGSA